MKIYDWLYIFDREELKLKKILYVLYASFIALFMIQIIVGCSARKQQESVLTIGIENDISELNPLKMKDPYTFRVGWQIYEGLVGLDEDGNIIPKLAERWEVSKDHKEWTFFLQKNVYFHTSDIFANPQKTRNVTAEDIFYSFTGYCSSNSYPAFMLIDSIKGSSQYNQKKTDTIEGLQVLDTYTIKFVLNDSEPFFLDRISSPWFGIFPKELSQNHKTSEKAIVIGTGPYKLIRKTDNVVELESNEHYWKSGVPGINKIVFRVIKNDQIRFLELQKGGIDFMVTPKSLINEIINPDGTLSDKYKKSFNLKVFPSFNSHFIGINQTKVTDRHLRNAITLAVNRYEIIKILNGLADVNIGTIPLNMRNFPEKEKIYYQTDIFDLLKAEEELKKSKYSGEEIELLVHDKQGSEQIGEIVQHNLKNIGINIKLVKLDYNSLLERMLKGNTELFNFFVDYVFSSPEPLLFNMFTSAKIPTPNVWAYNNKSIDEAIFSLGKIADRKLSFEKSLTIQEKVLLDVPAVFLFQQKNSIIYSKSFRNLKVNGFFHYMLEELGKVE